MAQQLVQALLASPPPTKISSKALRSSLASSLTQMTNATAMREVLDDPAKMRAAIEEARAKAGPALTQAQLAAQLGRLALHYWRPDFTAEHVKLMLADFFADLNGATESHVIEACARYRRNAKNAYFPTPGKLYELAKDDIALRRRTLSAIERTERLLAAEICEEPQEPLIGLTPELLAQIDAIFEREERER
ncbi:MAG: hypothetical protein HY243_15605 [Proteobacteria bacterium]|nr:hypothetical protein [Pseudomonadota bacterium]